MGEGPPRDPDGLGDPGELDEPGGVPRGGSSEPRDGRKQLRELGRGPAGVPSGDGLSESGAATTESGSLAERAQVGHSPTTCLEAALASFAPRWLLAGGS